MTRRSVLQMLAVVPAMQYVVGKPDPWWKAKITSFRLHLDPDVPFIVSFGAESVTIQPAEIWAALKEGK